MWSSDSGGMRSLCAGGVCSPQRGVGCWRTQISHCACGGGRRLGGFLGGSPGLFPSWCLQRGLDSVVVAGLGYSRDSLALRSSRLRKASRITAKGVPYHAVRSRTSQMVIGLVDPRREDYGVGLVDGH